MAKRRRKQDQPEIVRRDGGLGAYFVNTGSTKRKGVATYAELVAWGTRAGVLTAGAAEHLGRAAAERPGDAAAVTARALELRACLRRILLALATGGAPAAADLAALNA
ncbi:MAG: hypothetical protein GY719_04750, partial [bacterium]|nr:hypothetical protein [bacterium]